MTETRFGVRLEAYGPTDYLQEQVLPQLFSRLDLAFPEFAFKKTAAGWEATNAEQTRGARLVATTPRGFTVENGEARSWMAYVNGGRPPHGRELLVAARSLAALAGADVAVLERDLLPGEADRFEGAERRRNLLETFGSFARAQLLGVPGRYAVKNLVEKRGFAAEDIQRLDLGLYPGVKPVEEFFHGLRIPLEAVRDLGLLPAADDLASPVNFWTGRVVGLWRDRFGNAESCWALDMLRSVSTSGSFPAVPMDALESFLTSEDASVASAEYLYLASVRRDALAATGLDVALATREGRENLVLVERPLDALYLQSRGLPNVAAVGGGGDELPAARWERLASFGVRSATLAFSNDLQEDGSWPGREGALAAIETSCNQPNAPMVYVIDPAKLGASNDVAELVRFRRGSLEPLQQLLKERMHAFRYKAVHLIEKHKPEAEWTDAGRSHAIEEALEFDASVTVRDRFPDLDLFFWPEILEQTGVAADAVKARRDSAREKRGREALKRAYEELLAEAGQTLKTRRLDDVKILLRERVERLQAEERTMRADAVLSVADELAAHEDRLAPHRGGDLLGLAQRTLKSLDTATLGLRGLMLLAGGPATGKTALALQLGLDTVRANPDACLVFASLEMPRWDLYTRLRCALAGLEYKTLVFGSVKGNAEAFFKPEEANALREADRRLAEVGRRVRILDGASLPEPSVDRLLEQVQDLKARTGCKRALLVVDHLQVWPVSELAARNLRTDAELDRARVGCMKSLADAMAGDPVLVLSEARRPAGQGADGWTAAFAEPLGSFRGPYTPDVVLLLRAFTDTELAHAGKALREKDGRSEVDPAKLAELRDAMKAQGKAYSKLEIAKGRDGVLRGTLELTFWYRRSRFEEGRK